MTTARESSREELSLSPEELREEVRALRERVQQLERAETNWVWAEQADRENRYGLQTVVAEAPIVLWRLDANGVFTYAEGRGMRALGLKPENVIGVSARELFGDSPRLMELLDAALRGESVVGTVEYRGRLFDVCSEPIRDDGDSGRIRGLLGVSRDITQQRDAAECLRKVLQGTSATTGSDFFSALAEHLSRELNVHGSLICRVVGSDRSELAPLAVWLGGALLDKPATESVAQSPCEEVVKSGPLHVAEGVQARFPETKWLAEAGIESYLGVPVVDGAGQVIGSLSVLDNKPLTDRNAVEPVLHLFAARAAAEIDRQRLDDAVHASRERLRKQNYALTRLSKLEAIGKGHLEQAIQAITEAAAEILETARVNVWFYDDARTKITCKDQFELETKTHTSGYELTAAEYPTYFRAIQACRIIAATDAKNDPRTCEFTETYLEPQGIGAMLDAPIRVAGEMVGVVCHEHVGPPREWTTEEEQFAASLADYVALAIEARERRRAEEALREARDKLEERVAERTARLTQTNRRLRSEIEERRSTEAALRRSESRFRRLFESNIIGAFFATADGVINDANDAFLRMLGYESQDLPLRWVDVAPPAANHGADLRLTSNGDGPRELECTAKNGKPIPVYFGASRLDDDPSLCVAFIVDITDRKQAERALRQSEERLSSLVRTAPDFILVLDNENRIQFINRTNPGVSIESVKAADPFDLVEPEYHESLRATLDEVRRTGEFAGLDVFAYGLTGVPSWYTVRMGPYMQDNEIVGVTVIATDVTDRKKIEEALRESETQFRQLANTVGAAAFIYQDSRVRYVNRAASRITGYSTEELMSVHLATLLHPEDRRLLNDALASLEKDPSDPPRREVKLLCKDGQTRWVDFVSAPIDYEGRPALLGTAFDITDRKLAEEELLEKQDFLKGLLDTQERDRQMMAYEIHDGLIQEITAAKMHLEAFRRQQTVLSNRGERDFGRGLELLGESIGEARRLISGLRPPIIDERGIVAAIDYLIHERTVEGELAIEFEHDVAFTRLDPVLEDAVFRIVQEALNNVYRHSQAQRAQVILRQHDDHLHLEIRDWGTGFRLSDVPHDRFGLQGIRERARLLRGSARIDTHAGQGTSVTVELPLQESGSGEIAGSHR